jgi:hypothetical protein
MPNPLVIGCVGSDNPLVREYIHDFGLCTINLTTVEQSLRAYLEHAAMLRAEWHERDGTLGIKGKKYVDIKSKYARLTLGGLVSEYERGGGSPELVAALEPVIGFRNTLLHNHLPVTDVETMTITQDRLQALRELLHSISAAARTVSAAVQVADYEVFAALVDRMKREGVPPGLDAQGLQEMLEAFGRTVRLNSAIDADRQ